MTYGPILVFDYDLFVAQFPAYSNADIYPEQLLQSYWDTGTNFVSENNYGYLNGKGRQYGLNLLTAHIAYQADLLANGQDFVVLSGATIDKVAVTLVPPKTENSLFNWWLSTSPYGKTLRGLLAISASGGMYIGGSPEISAFRRAGGVTGFYTRGC